MPLQEERTTLHYLHCLRSKLFLGRSALVSKLILLKDIFVLSVINSSEDSELSSQTSMNLVYRLTQVTKSIEDVQPTSSSIKMTKLVD
jgi:hypothetical protein